MEFTERSWEFIERRKLKMILKTEGESEGERSHGVARGNEASG